MYRPAVTERKAVMVVVVATRREATAAVGFEAFYLREHAGLCRALAFSLRDDDLAAEAVDEAMARAYARWRQVSTYERPAAWVYRVARNWAISRTRRRWRTVGDPPLPEEGREGPEPADERLASALAALPEPQRAVVVLRYHLDWSTEQVAGALGVPPGTVKSRLSRALTALRESLEEQR